MNRSVVVMILAALAAGACNASQPSATPPASASASAPTSAVVVTVELGPGAAPTIGGTRFHVRLTDVEKQVREQDIQWPGGKADPIAVPGGEYLLEAWAIYTSDAHVCQIDPAASGGQRCTTDETVDAFCKLPITVAAGMTNVTYRYGQGSGSCALGPT